MSIVNCRVLRSNEMRRKVEERPTLSNGERVIHPRKVIQFTAAPPPLSRLVDSKKDGSLAGDPSFAKSVQKARRFAVRGGSVGGALGHPHHFLDEFLAVGGAQAGDVIPAGTGG